MANDKIVAYLIAEDSMSNPNIQIISDNKEIRSAKIKADLQDTSELNRNRRRYPKPALQRGLGRENVQELIARGSWFGEAGHPINPSPQRQMTVVQENASHRILSYKFRGDIVEGIVKTAESPMGYFMRNSILDQEDPMESAFSLRAMGPIKETSQGRIVQDPLTVITYDWVFFPSHRKAYQTEIIKGITESGNAINESVCLPLFENTAIDYIKEESKNYKIISELLESYGTDASLTNDNKHIILTEKTHNGSDKIVIGIEDYITREISEYSSKWRNR